MTPSIVAVLAIGGLLGFRHAFEPDHLAAVSTLATRPSARLWSAARLGLVWGLGHTVTVGAVALLIIALGISLPARFWPPAERPRPTPRRGSSTSRRSAWARSSGC